MYIAQWVASVLDCLIFDWFYILYMILSKKHLGKKLSVLPVSSRTDDTQCSSTSTIISFTASDWRLSRIKTAITSWTYFACGRSCFICKCSICTRVWGMHFSVGTHEAFATIFTLTGTRWWKFTRFTGTGFSWFVETTKKVHNSCFSINFSISNDSKQLSLTKVCLHVCYYTVEYV